MKTSNDFWEISMFCAVAHRMDDLKIYWKTKIYIL